MADHGATRHAQPDALFLDLDFGQPSAGQQLGQFEDQLTLDRRFFFSHILVHKKPGARLVSPKRARFCNLRYASRGLCRPLLLAGLCPTCKRF